MVSRARLRKRFGGSRSEGELRLDGSTMRGLHLHQRRDGASSRACPREAFYRATASVGHAELDAVSGDEPAIGDRLQKAISGS